MLPFHLIIVIRILCGCSFVPVQSQITVSRPISHNLPPELEPGLFGSPVDGSCSLTSGTTCDGTSVLNDGILPALSGVSSDPASQWASELFTMRRSGTDSIVVSLEFPVGPTHNRVELTVFNCPQWGIYAPRVIVEFAGLDIIVANATLPDVSCEYLLKFCVEFNSAVGVPNLKLIFPYQNNSDFVFLGEVTFINVPIQNSPCDPPQLITMRVPPEDPTTAVSTSISSTTTNPGRPTAFEELTTTSTIITINKQSTSQCTAIATTTGVVSAIITALLVAGICIAIHIAVYQYFYKPRLRSSTSTAVGSYDESHSQREDVMGSGDATVYDVVDERPGVGAVLEMRENEAYGITRST